MEIGFNIWKIAKLVTNRQDLNVAYGTWSKVENFLKKDLDSKVTDNGISESATTSRIASPMPAELSTFTPTPIPVLNKSKATVTNDSNDAFFNVNERTPYTSRTDSFAVMTANKGLNLNKPKHSSTANLAFGQTNAVNKSVPINNNGSLGSRIDWSRADSFAPMQATNTFRGASQSSSAINWNNSTGGKNAENLSALKTSSVTDAFGVMQPTSKRGKNVELKDDDDDGWGDFAVGSTTANNGWNGSLL